MMQPGQYCQAPLSVSGQYRQNRQVPLSRDFIAPDNALRLRCLCVRFLSIGGSWEVRC